MKTKPTTPRAGRPPLTDSALITKPVSMTAEQWEKALAIGGSYSAGVRVAIATIIASSGVT